MDSIEKINEEIGLIKGRDGIYLDTVTFENEDLVLIGDINCALCSKKQNARWLKYKMNFKRVKIFNMNEIELFPFEISHLRNESNIVLNKDSNPLKGKYVNFNHLFITTYDFNLEILCSNFEVVILESR